jgi:transposase-like protein
MQENIFTPNSVPLSNFPIFMQYDIECPFCECNYLSIKHGPSKKDFTCSNCGCEWEVVGGSTALRCPGSRFPWVSKVFLH